MLYKILKPLLFRLDAERAHNLVSGLLRATSATPLLGVLRAIYSYDDPILATECAGLRLANPIGLAAGFDKRAALIGPMAALGFGHVEVGTVTAQPQPGNPRPRMFRLPEVQGIINRMGFNNHGVDALLANVKAAKFSGILGINIGKNFDTAIERAADDYLACLEKVYALASYVTVNISSPNTKNLRQLQGESELDDLLGQLKRAQTRLAERHGRYVPLTLKIAPDLDQAQVINIADALRRHHIDGVIATNTTIARDKVQGIRHGNELGGLSGAPVYAASTQVVRQLATALGGELPIIAAGGITSGARAQAKIEAGAALVQIYSGLIYRGPQLVAECIAATSNAARR